MPLKEIDRGWGRIVQELGKMDGSYSKVGFPIEGDVGNVRKKGSSHKEYSDISEVAIIASWMEFGSSVVPERSFLRTSLDESIPKLIQLRNKLYKQIVAGRMTTERALGLIGEFMTKELKKKIVEINSPPNRPSTIERKKSDNPLIDTAQMLNSVQHVEVIK